MFQMKWVAVIDSLKYEGVGIFSSTLPCNNMNNNLCIKLSICQHSLQHTDVISSDIAPLRSHRPVFIPLYVDARDGLWAYQ